MKENSRSYELQWKLILNESRTLWTRAKINFHSTKQDRYIYIQETKEIILGLGGGEKRRKNLANWSSRRKGNVVGRSNTTGLEFNLTTRDKSSRGGPSTSLKALGVGIARARVYSYIYSGKYMGGHLLWKLIFRAKGRDRLTVSRASCPPTETNKINFRVHWASAMSARRAEGCTWPPFRRVDTLL